MLRAPDLQGGDLIEVGPLWLDPLAVERMTDLIEVMADCSDYQARLIVGNYPPPCGGAASLIQFRHAAG